MDELYALHSSLSCPCDDKNIDNYIITQHDGLISDHQAVEEEDMTEVIKSRIANHPLYPNLVSAYIQCRKVGATPDMVCFLEEICSKERSFNNSVQTGEIGADPQLDDFMDSYCKLLKRLKENISKPFDEASSFLNRMESQLSSLCRENLIPIATASYDEAGGRSDENFSCGDAVSESQESSVAPDEGESDSLTPNIFGGLKRKLLSKYSGYLSSLRKEFLKKGKKGKLPKDARLTLMDWWNAHCRWPYPTEKEKLKLSEVTGLDPNQINNWFINQRKRHWRPSEDLRFALMETVNGTIAGSTCFDSPGGGTNSTHT